MMSGQSQEKDLKQTESCRLIYSAVDSLVNLIAMPAIKKEAKMKETFGVNMPELFAKLSPDGLWLKTYQGYFQATIDDSFQEFSEIWPRWGIVSDGGAIELLTLVRYISARESLLLPTPTASDGKAWKMINKNDVQGGVWRYDNSKIRHAKKLVHYLAWLGNSLNQAVEYYETIMGFPRDWTDLDR